MNTSVKINPKMLTLARQMRGMTQKDLSEHLNASASTLSRIENAIDFVPIENELLKNLAETLSFDVDFFQKSGEICYPTMGYFRKNKAIPKRIIDKVQGYMNIYISMIDTYMEMINIPELNMIDWDIELLGSPETAATNLRKLWNLPKGRIDKLSKTVEDNGIIVVEFDFETDKINGFSTQTRKYNRPIIFINSEYPDDRKRLTIAHELGHIAMHINCYVISEHRDVEDEAFRFASEFLVPLRDVKAQLGTERITLRKLGSLKRYWLTSMHFFVYKFQHNRIITKNQARYLYQQLSPYRKREPVQIPKTEKPSLFGEMIQAVEREFKYKINDLAKMVGLKTDEFSLIRSVLVKNSSMLRIA